MNLKEVGNFNTGYIVTSLNSIYNIKLKEILAEISKDYSLNYEKLQSKYIKDENININMELMHKRKRKKNKQLACNELCMARKADNDQCTRRRKRWFRVLW